MDVERTKSLTETRTKSEDRKRQHWALRVAAEMAVGFQIHQEFKEKIVISVMNRPRAAGDSTSVGRLYAVRIFERSANNDQKLCAPQSGR
jgi:hypothetical protein